MMLEDIGSYKFIKKLSRLPFVDKIMLFGSRAKGVAASRADVDLAIVCPEANDENWEEVMTIIDQADTLLHIDCVRFDQIKSEKFRQAILGDCRLIYDRTREK